MHPADSPVPDLVPSRKCLTGTAVLLLTLDLVVTSDDLGIARRRSGVAASLAGVVIRWLLRRGGRRCGSRARDVVAAAAIARGAVVHAAVRLGSARSPHLPALAIVGLDEHVYRATFVVLRERVVLVVWFGELGDDVPRVEEARNLASALVSWGERGRTVGAVVVRLRLT